jgi:lactaldehyde dehydrogenase / glycolaldehyde dehydrogenase
LGIDSFNMKHYENFIEGKFVRGSNEGKMIRVFNPATEEEIAQIPESSEAEINRAIEAATRAQKKWAKLPAVSLPEW